MPGWQSLTTGLCKEVNGIPDCHFDDFMELIRNGMTDLILLANIFAIAAFMYAGFLWLTSAGSDTKHKQALRVLGNVIKGYAWILAAWVIVYYITHALVNQEFNIFLDPKSPQ